PSPTRKNSCRCCSSFSNHGRKPVFEARAAALAGLPTQHTRPGTQAAIALLPTARVMPLTTLSPSAILPWRRAPMTIYVSNMNANIAFHALITTHNITHVRITNTRLGRSHEIPVAGLDRIAGTDILEYTPDLLSEIEIDEA